MLVHFIGIGGAGMSGIARVLLDQGHAVSGSDIKESRNTLSLRAMGAQIYLGHGASNVEGADVVVVSSAIPQDNPEVKAAKDLKITALSRGEMLARLSEGKTSIAVAGTHGKTTATSMIASVMKAGGLDPTFLIGGELNDIGSNARSGQGEHFIAETDESDGSFLLITPDIAVITNIEADHLDYYGSITEVVSVFEQFLNGVKEHGSALICGDHECTVQVGDKWGGKCLKYGLGEGNDFAAVDVDLSADGSTFSFVHDGTVLGQIKLTVPGLHNVYNGLAAAALGIMFGLPFERVAQALAGFSGVKRRFELLGKIDNVTFVDDYAHHPTEIEAALSTARLGSWHRVISVFQPHRYSRTDFLKDEFGGAFDDADMVILTDVYGAGEEPVPGVSGKLLVDTLLARNPQKHVVYLPQQPDIARYLMDNTSPGDLVLLMGAGDLHVLGEDMVKTHSEAAGCAS